ncbi:MAG: hypothetical protein V1740_07240 [Candidatus Woesearchaeota archaeon]
MRNNLFLTLSIISIFLLFNINLIYGLNISIPPPPLPGQEGGNNSNASTPGDDLINDGGSGTTTTSTTQSSTPTSSTTSTTLSSSTTSTTHSSSTTTSTTQSGTPTTTSTIEPHEENPSSAGLPLIYIIFQVITLLAVLVLGAISISTSAKLRNLSHRSEDHRAENVVHDSFHDDSKMIHDDSDDIVILKDYVKRNLEKGIESSVIKDALIKSGWPASKVDQAFGQRWS